MEGDLVPWTPSFTGFSAIESMFFRRKPAGVALADVRARAVCERHLIGVVAANRRVPLHQRQRRAAEWTRDSDQVRRHVRLLIYHCGRGSRARAASPAVPLSTRRALYPIG